MSLFKGWPEKTWLYLGGLVLVGVALLVWGKGDLTIPGGAPKEIAETAGQPAADPESSSALAALEKELEEKLAANLSQISGAGQVQVSVVLSTGVKSDYASNQSVTNRINKETDQAGGTRETTEKTESDQLVTPGNSSQPVVISEQRPEIAGVLVIAEGAKDARIKERLHSAVQTLLDVPAAKVAVEAMGGK